jgi:hypothetical protein
MATPATQSFPITYQYESRKVSVSDAHGGLRAGVHLTSVPFTVISGLLVNQDQQLGAIDLSPGHIVNVNGANGFNVILPNATDLEAVHPDIGDGGGFWCYLAAADSDILAILQSGDGSTFVEDLTGGAVYPILQGSIRMLFFHRIGAFNLWSCHVA